VADDSYSAWDEACTPRPHEEWLRFMTEHDEFDPSLPFLVERDGELVAHALHRLHLRRRGWPKDVVVRKNTRGGGLARALLQQGLRASRALELYGRAGFVTDRRYVTWVRSP
jgi:GNAT superfamily N-acetyltransferase